MVNRSSKIGNTKCMHVRFPHGRKNIAFSLLWLMKRELSLVLIILILFGNEWWCMQNIFNPTTTLVHVVQKVERARPSEQQVFFHFWPSISAQLARNGKIAGQAGSHSSLLFSLSIRHNRIFLACYITHGYLSACFCCVPIRSSNHCPTKASNTYVHVGTYNAPLLSLFFLPLPPLSPSSSKPGIDDGQLGCR